MTLRKSLEKLKRIEKKRHHPLIHKIHKKYKISKKTLFYIKEYGPHTNVYKTIIKESLTILLFASIISSIGGLAIEYIKTIFVSLIPLIIMLPVLNDMIGDYGIIISSRFATLLHEGKIRKGIFLNNELKKLFIQVFILSILTAVLSLLITLGIYGVLEETVHTFILYKVFLVVISDVILLIMILFFTSIFAGLYFYKKNEDPNNFLIPIVTSIADFGNMVILAILVLVFF